MKLMNLEYIFLFFFLTNLCDIGCRQKEPETIDVVPLLQQTGQLVTAEYTLQKMVRASDDKTWYKLGDRKILISVQAIVKAGIDLQGITKEDVRHRDSVLFLKLPPPKVFSISLPPEKIRVEYQDVSFLRSPFSAAEKEALLRQAESQVRQAANTLGILQMAKANAATFLRGLLKGTEFKEVTVEFTK
jgi:hypothetical protein